MSIQTESRAALKDFIALLQEIDARWSGPEWNLHSPEDIVASHRSLMHTLETCLIGFFEQDATRPDFRRIVTPSRKLTGDNSDAIYFDAPVSAEHAYVIHGSMHGAAYFSLTIEEGAEDGKANGADDQESAERSSCCSTAEIVGTIANPVARSSINRCRIACGYANDFSRTTVAPT